MSDTFIPEELHLAVKHGMEFLDQHYPAWPQAINLSSLDLSSSARCILGQLYGDYWDGTSKFGLSGMEAVELGFWAASDYEGGDWSNLTKAWKRAISERLNS